jgi:hypothetical protein
MVKIFLPTLNVTPISGFRYQHKKSTQTYDPSCTLTETRYFLLSNIHNKNNYHTKQTNWEINEELIQTTPMKPLWITEPSGQHLLRMDGARLVCVYIPTGGRKIMSNKEEMDRPTPPRRTKGPGIAVGWWYLSVDITSVYSA